MKKRHFLAILAFVLTLVLAFAALGIVSPVSAENDVTEDDWISAPQKALVKCPGGDCDHSACDYVYSFALVGDTQNLNYLDAQNYVKALANNPSLTPDTYGDAYMKTLYNWILANKGGKNIQYVMGLGDITQSFGTSQTYYDEEWPLAKSAISLLDGKIGYSLVRGNHDISSGLNSQFGVGTEYYNALDAISKTTDEEGRPMGGFRDPAKIEDSYRKVVAGGNKYIIFTLEYYPTEETLVWMDELLAENYDYSAIVTLHTFVHRDATFVDPNETTTPDEDAGRDNWKETATGGNVSPRALWERVLSKHANVQMVISGHVDEANILRSTMMGDNGNTVTFMLVDPQTVDTIEPVGVVTMLYFAADGKVAHVEHISTVRDAAGKPAYLRDVNQFTMDLDYSENGETGWTETAYGYVPTKEYNAHAFHVLLDDSGKSGNDYAFYFGSYDSWYEANAAIYAVNEIGTSAHRNVKHFNVIMTEDSTHNTALEANWHSFQRGTITLDLGGHTLTSSQPVVNTHNRFDEYTPTIEVKNGNIVKEGSSQLITLQTVAKLNGSKVAINFENLNISYNGQASTIVSCYGGSAAIGYKGLVDINLTDCNIDTTGADGKVTLFNLKDANDNNDVTLTFSGTTVKGTTVANTVLYTRNSDILRALANENGDALTLIFTESASLSDIYVGADGGYYTFGAADTTGGRFTYSLAKNNSLEETPYGPIDSTKYPASSYPFALFSNGNFVKAYAKYYNFLAEAGTVVTTDSTLLLRSNWNTTDDGKSSGNLGKLGAHLTIDLGGHTITRGSYHLFQMMGYGTDVSLTVKNGTIVSGSGLPPIVFNNSGASANKETVTVVFDTVTFAPSTTTKKSLIVASYGDGTGAGMTANLTFNNCTFDLTKATASGNLIFNLMENKDANKSDISVVINGGQFKVKTYNQVFADYNAPRDGSTVSPDSVRFGKYNDSYTKFIATSSSSAPAIEPITVNGDKVAFDNSGTSSAPVYEFAPVTEYGTLPIKYADANAYPVVLFSEGKFVKAYATYYAFLNDVYNNGIITKDSTLLFRRDWNTTDDTKNSGGLGNLGAHLTIDLGGFTVTRGSYHLFQMVGYNKDVSVTIKNGVISCGSGLPPIVFNNSSASTRKENITVVFDDVKFVASSSSKNKVFFINSYSDGDEYGLTGNITFNNCTFDLAGATGVNPILFGLDDLDKDGTVINKNDITLTFNGGQFNATTFNQTFVLLNDARDGVVPDAVYFGTYNGQYTKFVATSTSAAPNIELAGAKGENLVFEKTGDNAYDIVVYTHTCAPAEHINAKTPTCIAGGNVEYWICECGAKYLDEACKNAADSVEIAVDADNHVIDVDATAWTKGEQTHYKACTCGARLEEKAHDGLNCAVCGNRTIGVYKSGDDLYFIEWNGKLLTGKFYVTVETSNELVEAGWYYADESGKFIKAGFYDDNGTLRYIENGKAYYNAGGAVKVDGKYYFIEWNGRVQIGKFYVTMAMLDASAEKPNTVSGWYYTDETGAVIMDGFYDDVDCKRYIVNGKTAYTRVTEIDGKFYMIDWDGEVKTGKFYITADSLNGYLNTSGWYYTYDDGSFINNDFHVDENGVKRYIVNGKAAYTQVTEINGDYYMIEWDGVVVINTEKFYITVNSVGVHSDKIKAGWNKTDADGKIIA